MHAIVFLIIVGAIVAGGFVVAFIWAVKNGQYEDDYSPAVRILFDDDIPTKKEDAEEKEEKNKDAEEEKPVNSIK